MGTYSWAFRNCNSRTFCTFTSFYVPKHLDHLHKREITVHYSYHLNYFLLQLHRITSRPKLPFTELTCVIYHRYMGPKITNFSSRRTTRVTSRTPNRARGFTRNPSCRSGVTGGSPSTKSEQHLLDWQIISLKLYELVIQLQMEITFHINLNSLMYTRSLTGV